MTLFVQKTSTLQFQKIKFWECSVYLYIDPWSIQTIQKFSLNMNISRKNNLITLFFYSIPGQEFGRFAGALSLKNCLLHICGESLENAHDAMSDTVALRKIAEHGAASQGKRIHRMLSPI